MIIIISDENQKLDVSKGRFETYRDIQWTNASAENLWKTYTTEPLSMSCNRTNGKKFDGFNFEGAPITVLADQRPRPIKSCSKSGLSLQNTELCDKFGDCIYSPYHEEVNGTEEEITTAEAREVENVESSEEVVIPETEASLGEEVTGLEAEEVTTEQEVTGLEEKVTGVEEEVTVGEVIKLEGEETTTEVVTGEEGEDTTTEEVTELDTTVEQVTELQEEATLEEETTTEAAKI